MKLTLRRNKKGSSKDNKIIDSNQTETTCMLKNSDIDSNLIDEKSTDNIEPNLINKKLPKELIIRIFSYLDIVSLCRCAQVSKYWNLLALDGSNLQYVDLFDFQRDISENVIESIAIRCSDFLKTIRLENCRSITDDSIKILCLKCNNIELLNLKQCLKLTDISFINIGEHLKNLTSLNLESCNISDNGLSSIAKGCSNLEAIELSWCLNLTSEELNNFVKISVNLKHISLKGLVNVRNKFLNNLAEHSPNLISLILNNCVNISDDGIVSIANNCRMLRQLCVANCKNLSDVSLIALGKNCHDLCIFESAGCSNLSDNGFAALVKGCSNLIRLDLEECNRITDTTIQNFAKNCSSLKHLTLSRCENITNEGISQITNYTNGNLSDTLQVLELDNCPLITDSCLDQLALCPNLVQLELYDCQSITRTGIKKFQIKCPQVKVHAYFAPSTVSTNNRPARSCACKCCVIL